MDTEANLYINGVTTIEVEKAQGQIGPLVRIRVKDKDGRTQTSLALWGVYNDLGEATPIEVVMLEVDERKKTDAIADAQAD